MALRCFINCTELLGGERRPNPREVTQELTNERRNNNSQQLNSGLNNNKFRFNDQEEGKRCFM